MYKCKHTRGFTLIELMIVVAIIAIIAAIAIPSILRSRMSANQTSAVASLDTVLKMNTQFRSNDSDNNGTNDYWTENVWGLYGIKSSGGDRIKLFSRSLARSDWEGQEDVGNLSGVSMDQTFPQDDLSPKSGYFVSMYTGFESEGNSGSPKTGKSSGSSCSRNYDDGDKGSEYTNPDLFGTMAFPSLYDATGTKAYTVVQGGDKFEIDAKSSSNLAEDFNGTDDLPNGTKYQTPPMECKPSDEGLNEFWGSTG